MNELCYLAIILTVGPFLMLLVCYAAAWVSGECAEREREKDWREFYQDAQARAMVECAVYGHDWIDEPLLSVHNRCRRCGAERERGE